MIDARVDMAVASSFLDSVQRATADAPGVTRDAYGAGEAAAHALLRAEAERLGLRIETDAAGNLYATLAGADPSAAPWIIGSHLDSVPHGGNFDGAAGICAGLAVVAGLVSARMRPSRPVTVMAIRAEESTWFPASYLGSRAAFGLLRPDEYDLRRADTGRTLAAHLQAEGFPPERLRDGPPFLRAAGIHAFVEVHIEQGPTLDLEGHPLGLVSAIAGSFRYREAIIRGAYGHSGAVPRRHRQDAVFALADLVAALDRAWEDLEARGQDATVTFGKVATDPALHAFSKIPGTVDFCLDVRSGQQAVLDALHASLVEAAQVIEHRRSVTFEFGPRTGSTPAVMSDRLIRRLVAEAKRQGISHLVMPSGAGHDAAVFASEGVPTAMIFVRNQNGSHNPAESMHLADLERAAGLLLGVIAGG